MEENHTPESDVHRRSDVQHCSQQALRHGLGRACLAHHLEHGLGKRPRAFWYDEPRLDFVRRRTQATCHGSLDNKCYMVAFHTSWRSEPGP
jgi:hypothetical protein